MTKQQSPLAIAPLQRRVIEHMQRCVVRVIPSSRPAVIAPPRHFSRSRMSSNTAPTHQGTWTNPSEGVRVRRGRARRRRAALSPRDSSPTCQPSLEEPSNEPYNCNSAHS